MRRYSPTVLIVTLLAGCGGVPTLSESLTAADGEIRSGESVSPITARNSAALERHEIDVIKCGHKYLNYPANEQKAIAGRGPIETPATITATREQLDALDKCTNEVTMHLKMQFWGNVVQTD